jgi:hypothetical protein
LLFGSPVVHGVHLLLWSLDSWLGSRKKMVELSSIKAFFIKPLIVDEEVGLSCQSEDNNYVKMELLCGQSILTKIEFTCHKSEKHKIDFVKSCFPEKIKPHLVLEEEIADKSGKLDLYLNTEAAIKMFPNLIEFISPLQISTLLATTRLVGTEVPGLHSVFSELSLLHSDFNKCTTLKYEVGKYDKRFGMVSMNITAPGLKGIIKAFIRPHEREQDSYLKIKKNVNRDEFKGQSALIIGGSRGLGEVTAKLLAAGSADVKFTYHQGREDANRIVQEINSNGGTANCSQYDVLSPDKDSFHKALNNWYPTHLYYFTTPFIFSGTKGLFSYNLFRKFCDYYVSGFANTMNILIPLGLRGVFYPSSIAIDELPLNMGEYAVAKTAGEELCMFYEKKYNDIIIYKPRLPRMDTDQTVSLFPVDNENPVPILLEHLRLLISGSDLK